MLIIEITERNFDTEILRNALAVPAARNYVAGLVTDDENGQETFSGDVLLVHLDHDNDLTVQQWDDGPGVVSGPTWYVDLANVRKLTLY